MKESEEIYKIISDNANDIISVFDENFNLLYINNVQEKISGFSREEVINKSPLEFMHPEDYEKAARHFKEALEKGDGSGEYRMRCKNGSYTWLEVSTKRIYDENKKTRAVIISRDINDRKIAEQKLKESEKKYKNAFDQVNFYKNLFAHDMNNILSAIMTSTEFLQMYMIEEKSKENMIEMIDIIFRSTKRGIDLINNVQRLSKVYDSEPVIKKIKLCSYLKEAKKFINQEFKNKNISIEIESFSKNIVIEANELLLDVFENIISNAIKYNNEKNIEIIIKILKIESDTKDFIQLEFIDNGIGIEDSKKQQVFEIGNTAVKGGLGMGIGLSLVKQVIESYNGHIRVEDRIKGNYSKGSNFILKIPQISGPT